MSRTCRPTRFEVIVAAYPLHAQLIAENCFAFYPQFFENFMSEQLLESHSARSILAGAFLWDFTPEGHKYWSQLSRGE